MLKCRSSCLVDGEKEEEEGSWQSRLTTVDGASLELDPDLLQFNEGDDHLGQQDNNRFE